MSYDTCHCSEPGYCPRFKRNMVGAIFATCHGDRLTPEQQAAYRKNWARLASIEVPVSGPIAARIQQQAPTNTGYVGIVSALAEESGHDPTLIGNRMEAMFQAIGIPACESCAARRDWLNRAHQWLRDNFTGEDPRQGQSSGDSN